MLLFSSSHPPPLRHLEVVFVIHPALGEQLEKMVEIVLVFELEKGESHGLKEKGHDRVFRVASLKVNYYLLKF